MTGSLSFNSRTPGGVRLSTHILRTSLGSFNSRTPGGVRRDKKRVVVLVHTFQFTHPGRGATA